MAEMTSVRKLADDFWEWRIRESPEFATMAGYHKYDDQLDVLTLDAYEKRKDDCGKFLCRVLELEKTEMDGEDKMTLTLLRNEMEMYLEGMKYKCYLYPINYMEGQHLDFEKTVSYMKFADENDYEKYLSRLQKFPQQMNGIIELLQQGIKEGRTNTQYGMKAVLDQIDGTVQGDPKKSGFYEPFAKLKELSNISDVRKEQLESDGLKLIKENLFGSFQTLRKFLAEEYLKNLRPDISCHSLPDGVNQYTQCLKYHNTCDLTPQVIHDLGLQEVKRIRENMDKVIKEVEFEGDFKAFLEYLRSDNKFYFEKKEDMMNAYRDIVENQIRPLLPKYFQNIPKVDLILKPTPEKEANSPAAYYYPPSEDGSRPGTFYVNCNNLKTQTKFEMHALCLHEAEPGHHFQITFNITSSLPSFQRHTDFLKFYSCPSHFPTYNAYVEGWGLYCEYLGEEMGLYKDPYSLFGRYSMEILRGCRLVVDTGMHALGWSRDQAIKYLQENTAMGYHNIISEIDRYITWPGQACAYKIGELKIRELREKSKKELGDKFDVRAFHEAFLSCGCVPISVLEKVIDEYIQKNK
ncbi:uncharacterized protein [Ptychodera flava]|uniref:uncharacterized protein isoform X2 n=1 Tax=Ptychodera flava TaxID=63121 RepID=UPI00396A44C3